MITIVITLAIVGFLLWLVTTYIPMEPVIKQILVIIVVFAIVLWLLQSFGLLGSINSVQVK